MKQDGKAHKGKAKLTEKEIKEIRLKSSLSQKEFSSLLGLGEVSIARYEKTANQSRNIDNLIRSSEDDALFLYDRYLENKHSLALEARKKALSYIKRLRESEEGKKASKMKELRFLMLPYVDEVSLTGDASLSLEDIASLVNIGKEKNGTISRNMLNKYLFCCDFLAFYRLGRGISGLVYKKVEDGVEPRFLDEILSYPSFKRSWKVAFDKNGSSFLAERVESKCKCSLSAEEKEIAKTVKEHLSVYSERELSLRLLKEKALKKLKKGELIDYSLSSSISIAKW